MAITEFRAQNPADSSTDTDLYDLRPLTDAFNRRASGGTLSFLDTGGTKQSDYPYGRRVAVQYSTDGGGAWATRLEGIVADATPTRRDGVPQLDVDIVAYDHLLRRRKVYKTYSSSSLSTILKDLIETFTSVTWNASNVNLVNDVTITREFKGEHVDEAIAFVLSESANEEFGVNGGLEFFVNQQDASRADSIGDADVIDHDFPREGKRAVNRFKLFYGQSGSESAVVVEDREAQLDLKDKLAAPRRVVISDSDTMPEIASESRAEAMARQRLGEKSVTQTGTVTVPIGRFDTEPGDVLELTVSDAGITAEDFRVAQVEYHWQRGQTKLTVAEQTQNIDDLLVGLSDSVDNVRARDAKSDAAFTRFLDFRSGVELSVSATIKTRQTASGSFVLGQSQLGQGTGDTLGGAVASTSSVTVESKKVTKAMLNLVRDLWQDGNAAFVDQTHLGVGTDDQAATRGDSGLQASVERYDLRKFGDGNAAVTFEYVATVPAGGVAAESTLRELGVFDADSGGTCYLRLTHGDVGLDASTRLSVHVVVEIDTDADEQGVVTTTGQQRLVDLVVGESGHAPTDFVYGTGTASEAESDASLGAQVHEDTIDSTADRKTGLTDVVERIATGEANGNDISETGAENAANELLARIVYEAVSKTSDFALETDWRFRASNA